MTATDAVLATAEQFRAAQVEACQWLRAHTSYPPNRFQTAIVTMDGDQAVRFTERLIEGDPTGFARLAEIGELWWSLEAAVLREQWAHLFSGVCQAYARWTLAAAGIADPVAFANRPRPGSS